MNETQVLSDQEINELRESTEQSIEGAERRTSKRLSFSVVQSIAQYNGTQLPKKAAFVKVLCKDISTSGISFLMPHQPEFDHAVIALGTPPCVIYVAAHFTNVRPAKRGFFVGCSFVGKVTIEA